MITFYDFDIDETKISEFKSKVVELINEFEPNIVTRKDDDSLTKLDYKAMVIDTLVTDAVLEQYEVMARQSNAIDEGLDEFKIEFEELLEGWIDEWIDIFGYYYDVDVAKTTINNVASELKDEVTAVVNSIINYTDTPPKDFPPTFTYLSTEQTSKRDELDWLYNEYIDNVFDTSRSKISNLLEGIEK